MECPIIKTFGGLIAIAAVAFLLNAPEFFTEKFRLFQDFMFPTDQKESIFVIKENQLYSLSPNQKEHSFLSPSDTDNIYNTTIESIRKQISKGYCNFAEKSLGRLLSVFPKNQSSIQLQLDIDKLRKNNQCHEY